MTLGEQTRPGDEHAETQHAAAASLSELPRQVKMPRRQACPLLHTGHGLERAAKAYQNAIYDKHLAAGLSSWQMKPMCTIWGICTFTHVSAGHAPPRSLLTMRVARASDSTSSAMMSSGFWVLSTASSTGISDASLGGQVLSQCLIPSRVRMCFSRCMLMHQWPIALVVSANALCWFDICKSALAGRVLPVPCR